MARIMIIEDEPAIAEIFAWNFRRAGHEVVVASDGLEALQALDAANQDLVILDLDLPTVSGFRLIKLLKRHFPGTPVIVVTALAFEEAEDVARAGVDDFITKPCDPNEVVSRAEQALARLGRPNAGLGDCDCAA